MSVAHLRSWSAGEVRIVHGKSSVESVPRSRYLPTCDVPAWRGGRCTCASVEAKGGEMLSSFSEGERGGLCAGVRVCVDVGRAPAKVVVQASASPSGVDELKDESSSSSGTASVRLQQLNRNNEQGITANEMFASLHK